MKYVDFRFTDPRGKWQHVTFDVTHDRRGHVRRRPDVRRLLDRRLEGDQRVRHEPDAGPGHRLHRSVLRRDDAGAGLRRARADHRRALQPRSARHRQEGRGAGQVDGHRRHHLFRPGSRVLHVRRRQVFGRALQHRLQARLDRTADQLRHRLRGRQSRPPHRHQEGLFPGAAAGLRAGHALRDARRHGAHGLPRSKSTTTKWRRPSTNSA